MKFFRNVNYQKALLLALFIHIMIILAFTHFYRVDMDKTGWKNAVIIQSYLYKPLRNSNNSTNATEKKQERKNKKNIKVIKKIDKRTEQLRKTQKQSSNKAKYSQLKSNLSQGQYDQLLILLHNQIEQHQYYPNNAQLLNQQGTVKLSFVLLPDGNIINIQIKNSSGYTLLDQAAIMAIKNSIPIKGIKLKHSQLFILSLVYSLSS